jgi:arginine deiminase
VVTTAQVLTDANLNLLDGTKYLVQIEASELSRARGGPRCMTMPLSRESLRG